MEDNNRNKKDARVTLRMVADHVGLTPGTISAVLNDTYAARRIPQPTKDRIMAAVREFNYQPNPLARALRAGQSVMSGAMSGLMNNEARENSAAPTAHWSSSASASSCAPSAPSSKPGCACTMTFPLSASMTSRPPL